MTTGECVTAAGVKYTVVDGKLLPVAEDSSGQVNPGVLLALFILLQSLRYRGYYFYTPGL